MFRQIASRLVLLVLFLALAGVCYAQAGTEAITFTTYYPSPYGSYNELQSNKIGVGDINGDGQINSSDLPAANGLISVARGIVFTPQNNMNALPNPAEGEVVYNKTDGSLYVYNGSKQWVKAQPSGSIACNWPNDARWLSHGWDGNLAWANGIFIHCNSSGYVDWMKWIGTQELVKWPENDTP